MARIDSFLRLVVEQRASDLHFSAGVQPIVRHDGDLVPIPFRVLSEAEARRFIEEILIPQEMEQLDQLQELDFVYHLENVGRFRVNVFMHSRGVGAVFRVIPDEIPRLESLMMPQVLKSLARSDNGLALICGPTGSGKTTTLAALVSEINSTQHRHIITIEDPVEYVHRPDESLITQRQVGLHTESFAGALRSALREAPDVLVVGEMRDPETISLALAAAETGVLVFGTLHTNSAAKAIDRIIDAYPEDARDQVRGSLSMLLKGVIAQQLVKRASGEGRVAVVETLLNNIAVANMIRENKVHRIDAYLRSPENEGSGIISRDASILRLIREGLITLEEGLKVAQDRKELIRKAKAEPEPSSLN